MEAVVETGLAILLMLAALAVLARSWPRSSRRGGYRVWSREGRRDGSRDSLAESQERGVVEREEAEVHWHWDDSPASGQDQPPPDEAEPRT